MGPSKRDIGRLLFQTAAPGREGGVMQTFVIALLIGIVAQTTRAFADTVDANAQPYMIVGGLAVGLAAGAFGISFILRGVRRRKMAALSLQWPVTDGKIEAAAVKTEMRHDAQGARMNVYIPEARYAYKVDGKQYEGNVIRPGIEQFGYSVIAAAQAHVALYKTGATVPVHYDPADPSVAVLEASEYGGMRNLIAGTIGLLVGISSLVFAAWTASLDPQ
jgi:hypothetical protein